MPVNPLHNVAMEKTLKIITSVLILICFFLPLTQCQISTEPQSKSVPGEPAQPVQALPALQDKHQTVEERFGGTIIMAEEFVMSEPETWLWLLLFSWPLLFVVLQLLVRHKAIMALTVVAPILAALTIYYIGRILSLGTLLYGGYLWSLAMGLYTFVCLWELYYLVAIRFGAKKPTTKWI